MYIFKLLTLKVYIFHQQFSDFTTLIVILDYTLILLINLYSYSLPIEGGKLLKITRSM